MKKIFLLVLFLLVTSFVTNIILDHYYKKHWETTFNKLDTVFKDTSTKDIVFVGDSRVHFGINPFYVDSITSKNSYNIGMGGASINEIIFLTKAWLNNHKPPQIFAISIGLAGLLDSTSVFSTPSYYFYYLNDTLVYSALSELKYHTFTNKIFPITKFTSFDEYQKTTIVRSIRGDQYLKKDGISYKGFVNNENGNNFNERGNFNYNVLKINTEKWIDSVVQKLTQLVSLIKKKNSTILFVYPPAFGIKQNKEIELFSEKLTAKIDTLSAREKIKTLRFEKDSSFTKSLFQDPSHLNIRGSVVYSTKLGLEIKDLIK